MPTVVEKSKELTIGNKKLVMRPLKIGRLKKFMAEFDKLSGGDVTNESSLDTLIACCAVAMEQYDKEMATVEFLENELDLDDVYLIVEAATGIKLGGDAEGNQQAATAGTI